MDDKKIRTIKITDKTWRDFQKLKNRQDKSWDLYLTELFEAIKKIKEL